LRGWSISIGSRRRSSIPSRFAARRSTGSWSIGSALDGLLVDWLGALLAEKDVSGLVFGRFEVQIAETADGYRLDGVAWGEPIDVSRHRIGVEVKGISYLGLAVRRERSGESCAEFVLDV